MLINFLHRVKCSKKDTLKIDLKINISNKDFLKLYNQHFIYCLI